MREYIPDNNDRVFGIVASSDSGETKPIVESAMYSGNRKEKMVGNSYGLKIGDDEFAVSKN